MNEILPELAGPVSARLAPPGSVCCSPAAVFLSMNELHWPGPGAVTSDLTLAPSPQSLTLSGHNIVTE